MAEPMLHAPELAGIELPPRLGSRRPTKEEVAPWLDVVEHLVARGVITAYRVGKILGVTHRTAASWLDQVHRRWAKRLSEERMNWRREALWHEADAVTRAAWQDYASAENVRDRAALLKVILMANQRKSAITGLDRLELSVSKRVEKVNVNVVTQVTQELGLSPAAMRELGKHASKALSSKREDQTDVTHDVEVAAGAGEPAQLDEAQA